ncbi:hypothetical protein [Novosphingobium sp. Gsoil 351]|uniref:hypothetical protein n=1 Tax=Novosphingobium sp. Gsoil 351 TaxID=2675225 RepID=UPI0012B4453E|nr:hypothetical protein [Novosphingobium sp. Gsoil 351]QGN55233.1 hypothetical protein GKE62_12445 [Novosphingobium sp. Gsoil 351]
MDDSRRNDDFAPEAHNVEQDDEDAQAQTVADQALRGGGETLSDSEKVPGGDPDGTPDLVDHMNQMASSGRIDMSAFRGERSDDDEEGLYGEGGIEDDTPRGAE